MPKHKDKEVDATIPARIEEFKSLRSEIELRIRLRSQLLAISLTLFGVLATLNIKGTPIELLLLYPLLAAFIAGEWCYHDLRIFAVADYIKKRIEPKVPGIGWQHYLDETRQYRWLRLTALSAGGIFVGASVLSLLMVGHEFEQLFKEYGQWVIVFFVIDGIAIACSIASLCVRRVDKKNYQRTKK